MRTLVAALLPINNSKSSRIDYEDSPLYESIRLLTLILYHSNLQVRDAVVSATQCNNPEILRSKLNVIDMSECVLAIRGVITQLDPDTVVDTYNSIPHTPLFLGLIQSLAKQEAIHFRHRHQVNTRIDEGIYKELHASQHPDNGQKFCYDGVFLGSEDPLHDCVVTGRHGEVTSLFIASLEAFKARYQHHVFVPAYNAKKNIGYSTQYDLCRLTEQTFNRGLTSLDLEKFYHSTGSVIHGPMEVRYSWKSSQTKPRVYYANGGTSYFTSRFLRLISKELTKTLPSTHPSSRFIPESVGYIPLSNGEVLITYDYTSFTTTLSELKYFLHYLSDYFSGFKVRVLDTYSGVEVMDLGEILQEYNEVINTHASFDLARLSTVSDVVIFYQQCSSGMLGAQGNINFSMLLHGLNVEMLTHHSVSSCVGDDALLRSYLERLGQTRRGINKLCAGNAADKGHEWVYRITNLYSHDAEDPDFLPDKFKFLKAPIWLTADGHIAVESRIVLPNFGELFNISAVADPHPTPTIAKISKFLRQYTRFLTRLQITEYQVSEQESTIILAIMESVYSRFGLPTAGSLPGLCRYKHDTIHELVPALDESVFVNGPVNLVVSTFMGTMFEFPDFRENHGHSGFLNDVGDSYTGLLHAPHRVLRDLGYISVTPIIKMYTCDGETENMMTGLITGRLRQTYEISVIKTLPSWANDMIYEDIQPDQDYEPYERTYHELPNYLYVDDLEC